jgi:hypothetical protein
LAAAAALFIAAAGVYLQSLNSSGASSVTKVSYVDALQTRHVQCGSGVAALHMADLFPTRGDVGSLPGAVGEVLKVPQPVGSLDLASVGYEYFSAGLCTAPGDAAVHVVYLHTDGAGRQRSLSLWVKPVTSSQQAWDDGEEQQITERGSAHPVIAWREGELAYFLVGDAMEDLEAARKVLSRGQAS